MSNKKISEFKIGEVVVYPKHGVGEIIKIESMEVSSIKTKFYVSSRVLVHIQSLSAYYIF